MAKKNSKNTQALPGEYSGFMGPSTIGGVLAYSFSNVVSIGITVFAAVWLADWLVYFLTKRK